MDSIIELHHQGRWRPAAALTASAHGLRFEYLLDYVFGDRPQQVALGLPVTTEVTTARPGQANTPLAFLWDLVPQGRGRQHLANLLGISADDPGQDLELAGHGAFAPIGRLRLDTAVRFYEGQARGSPAPGFTLDDMVRRADTFVDQLVMHSMLAAGTPGVQGVAPKFLLTQDGEDRWFPDVALPDARARRHWIVKLPRGREPADRRVLRHEGIYLQVAAACGLRSIPDARVEQDMLFLPRFDRQVDGAGVVRLHQESFAALVGAAGFGRSASLFALTERLAAVATDPAAEVAEFLCRDAFNRALRNPDNHLRNSAMQQLADGTIRLTPLYDTGPMYLDPELITRTCHWRDQDGAVIDDWNRILEQLQLADALKADVAARMRAFATNRMPRLPGLLQDHGADADIVEACRPTIEQQVHAAPAA
jgi:Uncharacterized protein related to capsule biosynthesis enzymes